MTPTRNQRIDILRGIAIFLVLLLHFHIAYHLDQSSLNIIFSVDFIKMLAGNGNYGVTIFFVISGFLITSKSLDRFNEFGKVDMLTFYLYRFARIMPCLWLVLVLFLILNLANIPIFQNKEHSPTLFLSLFSVLTFWHNQLMVKSGYFNYCLNILWSLSVEEIFYLFFPLVCLFVKKTRLILIFWLALVILGPFYRSLYSENEIIALYGYFSCFDAVALGCLAATLFYNIQFPKRVAFLLTMTASLLILVAYFYTGIMENVVFGISIIALATALLLITQQPSVYSTGKISQLLSWLGKNSYELYLFHIIILALMKEIVAQDALNAYGKLIWFALFLSLSIVVAELISRFFSEPLNKKIRHLFLPTGRKILYTA